MDPEIHTPVEIMGIIPFGEEAAVARPEIELQGHRRLEFVFEAENAVGTALAEIAARIQRPKETIIVESTPAVADAGANTDQTIKTTCQVALEHEVRIQLQRPNVNTGEIQIAETPVRNNILGAQIHLDGKMISRKSLEREGLRIPHRDTNPVFIRGLSLCIHQNTHHNSDGEQNF